MVWLEIRKFWLVVLVIFVLCKKSFQNKPEYEFAPTLSFEPVTFVHYEDKQSNNKIWNTDAPQHHEIRMADVVPDLSSPVGLRRLNRQATYPGQFGHASAPTGNAQNGFNNAVNNPGDHLLMHPSYGSVTPSPQYPYYNNFQSGQLPYYPTNNIPGHNQYPGNSQPGLVPQYPNNAGSGYHQTLNHSRPGYTQPSAPNPPNFNQYQHNYQPGQLAQYSTSQRPGYPGNQYPSNTQFGVTQQNSGYVTPGYNIYQHNNQPGQLPQNLTGQRPGNQYPTNLQFGQTLPNSGITPGYHQRPSFNQSSHLSQYPTTQRPSYYQVPSYPQPGQATQYPSNQNHNNYPNNYNYRYKRYSSPSRPGNSQSLLNLTTRKPGSPQVIPGFVRPE